METISDSSSTPARILIVDDHPNTAAMLARVLTKLDTPVEVLTACNGEEALKFTDEGLVDILITDFMMPGMNGLELIEKFQGREPKHMILITAYDTPGLALTARRLKVQDYLVKPVQPEKIRDIVVRALQEIQPAKRQSNSADDTQRPAKVLIADDYPDNIRLLASRLRSEGYSYISAEDGEEALIKIRAEMPDIVLLDVNMPKKDGFIVLAEMRADPEISHIPVIIITAARIGPNDIREGLTLGADDYITKPFDWRELAARIRSKLRVKQAEDVLRRRNRELGILPEISRDLSDRLDDIDKLAKTILNRTVETLGASDAFLIVHNPDNTVTHHNYQGKEQIQHLTFVDNLAAHVTSNREGLLVTDVISDDRWSIEPNQKVRSSIAVPLIGSREVLGALTLTHDQPAHFKQDHLSILQAIASQAAIALENIQLLAMERKRVQELVALNQITRQISLFTHTEELFERLPELIQASMGYPAVALWLMEGGQLIQKSIAGVENAVRTSLLEIAPQQAASTGQPAQISGSVDERTGNRFGTGTPPVQSSIAVPLFWHSKINGVISIHSKQLGAFQESDRVVLETLSTQVASAYERVLLFESIERQRQRLAAVLNAAADAILVVDEQGRLQLMNQAGEQLFTDIEAQVGRQLPINKGYDEFIALLNEGRQSGYAEAGEINWPDGRTFSMSLTPVENGGQVAVLHDVSRFKTLDQIKNEFLATATHDLKNPIFAVQGYSDLLKKAGPLNETQLDFIGRIRNASLQMQDLVLNLLEIARMEMSPELELQLIDMHEMLDGIVTEFISQAETRGHSLNLTPSKKHPFVKGDKTRLQQVMRNLVSNALKYTPDGGQIIVSADVEDSKVIVKVKDTGIGIPSESLPFVFDQFYRVHTEETRDIEGNGLGLAIVKSIIEQHGGEVMVESTLSEGSCFSFNLNFVPLPESIANADAEKPTPVENVS